MTQSRQADERGSAARSGSGDQPRQEARLRAFIAEAPAAIAMFDRDMRYIAASRRWLSDYGLGGQDLTGRQHYEVFPEIGDRIKDVHRRSLAGETLACDEERFERTDGRVQWLCWDCRPWYEPDGTIGGIIVFTEDITGQVAAREALRASEELFRAVFERAPIGIALADTEGRFTRANSALQQMLGRSEAEIVGKHFNDLTHPDDRGASLQADRLMAVEHADRVEIEKRYLRADGEGVPAHVVLAPLRDADDQVVQRIAMINDIGERLAANEALRESEERLRLALQGAGGGTWDWDLTSGVAWWSPEMYALWGVAPGTLMQLDNSLAAIHPDDRAGVVRSTETAIREGIGYRHEFRILHPERGERWVTSLGRVVAGADGAPLRLIGLTFDISERIAARDALAEREQRLKQALEAGHLASWELDLTTGKGVWNDECFRMQGYRPHEVEPSKEAWLARVHPEDRRATEAIFDQRAAEGGDHNTDFRVLWPDGTIRWLEGYGRFEHDAGGKPSRAYGVMIDRTEAKRIEAALERDRRMQAVGQMAGGIAHDFNNLLAAIVGNLELAEREDDVTRIRGLLRRALDAAAAGASFNHRLLSLANRGGTTPGDLEVGVRLGELASLLARVIGERIGIETALDRDLWPVHVDRGEFDSAIMNLCVNARDAMPDGGRLRLHARNVELATGAPELDPGAAPGDYVRVGVEDEGIGMSPEVRERAIEPFFTTKEPGRGTGLGLGSVYAFVRRAGGFMTIRSQPGEGTAVHLFLPRAVAAAKAGPDFAGEDVPYGDGELVLVVEDDRRVREMTLQRLEVLGYAVAEAATAVEAIRLLAAGEPVALVFSDVVMPGGVSGYDLAEWLRAHRPEIAILLTSGYHDAALAGDRPAAPGQFLAKPHTLAQLAQALRALLDTAQAARTSPVNT